MDNNRLKEITKNVIKEWCIQVTDEYSCDTDCATCYKQTFNLTDEELKELGLCQ